MVVRSSQQEQSLLPLMARTCTSLTRISQSSARARWSQTSAIHRRHICIAPQRGLRLHSHPALLLGVVGLYGVIAYSVSQRTREIGVRMALGAQRNRISGMVLREAMRLIVIGIAAGVAGSLATAGLLRPLLFGIQPWDWTTLAGVALLLAAAAMFASYLPAHRAASVNPVDALRAE